MFATRLLAAFALGFAAFGLCVSPADSADKPAAKGFEAKAYYAANCAACHGAAGQGAFGPTLKKVGAKGDKVVAERITQGSPKGMPAYDQLKPAELKALVAFVKAL